MKFSKLAVLGGFVLSVGLFIQVSSAICLSGFFNGDGSCRILGTENRNVSVSSNNNNTSNNSGIASVIPNAQNCLSGFFTSDGACRDLNLNRGTTTTQATPPNTQIISQVDAGSCVSGFFNTDGTCRVLYTPRTQPTTLAPIVPVSPTVDVCPQVPMPQCAPGTQLISLGKDQNGCLKGYTCESQSYQNPQFKVSKKSGVTPLKVMFSANVGGFSRERYQVDFGDGSVYQSISCYAPLGVCLRPGTIEHTYTKSGNYRARLIAKNASTGVERQIASQNINVEAKDSNSELRTYQGYLDGHLFITTPQISLGDALKNCRQNEANNPQKSIRCTWHGQLIYETKSESSDPTYCPAVYEPVCGRIFERCTDRLNCRHRRGSLATYSNLCALRSDKAQFVSNGRCPYEGKSVIDRFRVLNPGTHNSSWFELVQ